MNKFQINKKNHGSSTLVFEKESSLQIIADTTTHIIK